MKLESFKEFIDIQLDEALVKVSNKITLSTRKLVRRLQRETGFKFHRYPGLYRFARNGKKGIGARYFIGNTLKSVRFNYTKSGIDTIDVWDATMEDPRITIHMSGKDPMQFIKEIADMIKLPRVQQIEVITEGVVNIPVTRGRPEQDLDPDLKSSERLISSQLDPDIMFNDLRELVMSVVRGQTTALLVTGLPGTGKSVEVESRVKRKGKSKYKIYKGVTSPFGLYRAIYESRHPGNLILFDDSDSVFNDTNSANILKAALDSGSSRFVSWISRNTISPDKLTPENIADGKLPSSFKYQGNIIFVSNKDKTQIDRAIVDRTLTINISMSTDDIIARVQKKIKQILPKVDISIKKEVLNFMSDQRHSLANVLNMRTFVKGVKLRQTGSRRWKDLILRYA